MFIIILKPVNLYVKLDNSISTLRLKVFLHQMLDMFQRPFIQCLFDSALILHQKYD